MPIEPQVISGFHGGVSQQSPVVRADNQCEEAINCSFSIAKGCSKRPPIEVVNLLSSNDLSDNFYHWITDKNGDRYLLVIESEALAVYRLSDGQKLTVLNDTAQTYLTSADPRRHIRALTRGSKTYIVNTETVVTATGSTSAGAIAGTAQSLQDDTLGSATEGAIYKIIGHESIEFDVYYAKKTGGKWFEWVEPGISDELDSATMPHVLELIFDEVDPFGVRFEFVPVTWGKRLVGDEDSNKFPTFTGTTINAIFDLNGRLGFLSPSTICMSEVDEPHNFFRTTVVDLLDTARIDLEVKSGTTSPLRWAKPLNKNVILFTETAQYNLSGEPVITSGTARIDLATSFETSAQCEPTNAGSNLFFTVNSGNHSNVREMYVQDLTVTTDATDATAHVDSYIPKNVTLMEAQNNYDFLAVFSEETKNKLWTYFYHYNGDQKIQSAWGQWEFNENISILNMKVVDSYLFVIFTFNYTIDENLGTKTTETFLGKINLKIGDPGDYNDSFNKPVCLDFLTVPSAAYDGDTNRTLITHNFPIMAPEVRDDLVMVLGQGHGTPGVLYEKDTIFTFQPGNNLYSFYVAQDFWTNGTLFLGTNYTQSLELSRQYYRGNGNSMATARMQIRNIMISYLDTAAFEVHVKVEGRDDVGGTFITDLIETYSARVLGTEYFNLNAPTSRTGSRRFPVLGNAANTTITLVNKLWDGANFIRGEMEALVSSRTRKI